MSEPAADLYKILGVSPDSDARTMEKAFRAQAHATHPDLHPNNEIKRKEFQALAEAYEVLRDPDRRRNYDQTIRRPRTQQTPDKTSSQGQGLWTIKKPPAPPPPSSDDLALKVNIGYHKIRSARYNLTDPDDRRCAGSAWEDWAEKAKGYINEYPGDASSVVETIVNGIGTYGYMEPNHGEEAGASFALYRLLRQKAPQSISEKTVVHFLSLIDHEGVSLAKVSHLTRIIAFHLQDRPQDLKAILGVPTKDNRASLLAVFGLYPLAFGVPKLVDRVAKQPELMTPECFDYLKNCRLNLTEFSGVHLDGILRKLGEAVAGTPNVPGPRRNSAPHNIPR